MKGDLGSNKLLLILALGLLMNPKGLVNSGSRPITVPFEKTNEKPSQLANEGGEVYAPQRSPSLDLNRVFEPISRINRRIRHISTAVEEIASSAQNLFEATAKLRKSDN